MGTSTATTTSTSSATKSDLFKNFAKLPLSGCTLLVQPLQPLETDSTTGNVLPVFFQRAFLVLQVKKLAVAAQFFKDLAQEFPLEINISLTNLVKRGNFLFLR